MASCGDRLSGLLRLRYNRGVIRRFAMLSAFLAFTAVSASPPTGGGKEIVVTGQKATPPRIIREATARITARAGDQVDQVARFSARVCPRVEGLEDRYEAIVEQRIRDDAASANVDVAKPGCTPNLIVMAVDSGQAILAALHKAKPEIFGAMSDGAMKRLLGDAGPVHVLNLTEMRPAQGPRLQALSDIAGLGKDVASMEVREASIIKMATRQDISGSLVLIDQRAMLGKTLRQIADYAIMRGAAVTEVPMDGLPTDSILALFSDGASPPASLTGFDRSYLDALYRGSADLNYNMMVGQIAHRINHRTRPRP